MKIVGFLILMIATGTVSAQCPAGIPSAGNPACIPPDRVNSPYYQSSSGGGAVSRVRWEDRWGAIAVDENENSVGIGVASMMSSDRKAKKVALDQCRKKGGMRCVVALSYRNQCGVMIAGKAGFNTTSAATVDEAAKYGFDKCKSQGLQGCKIYYSDCSYAERDD